MSGTIPSNISYATNLQSLALVNGKFHGPVLEYLKDLTELKEIYLKKNYFDGTIPEKIFHKNLITLNLERNNFHGNLTSLIGNAHNIEYFNVQNNKLSGPIPQEIWDLMHLEIIEIRNNKFTGEIPQSFCDRLEKGSIMFKVDCDENIDCTCCNPLLSMCKP